MASVISISKEEVIKIAKLARLELTEEETEKMQKDLTSILDYFEILKKAPTPKVSPVVRTTGLSKNVVREDVSTERNSRLVNDLLGQVPDRKEDYIKVKNIF